jgi:phage FluMu protein Com
MRCPDCNKFVPYDEPEVEGDEPDITGSTVSGQVRIVLKCADCGNELKEANLDYEVEIEHDCPKYKKKDEEPEFTADGEPEFSATDRTQTTCTVKGKVVPIKSMRYAKRYYGADINGTVTCSKCSEVINYSTNVEEQASGFEQLV